MKWTEAQKRDLQVRLFNAWGGSEEGFYVVACQALIEVERLLEPALRERLREQREKDLRPITDEEYQAWHACNKADFANFVIARRLAALTEKPDPRVEVICALALASDLGIMRVGPAAAKSILVALDAAQPKVKE